MRALVNLRAGCLPLRTKVSSRSRSPGLSFTTYVFTAISFAAVHGNAKIGEQERGCLGFHRGAAIGMQGEHLVIVAGMQRIEHYEIAA
jgi:hypothetical protein